MLWRALATAGEFRPQNVANLLWALAMLGKDPGGELTAAMLGRAQRRQALRRRQRQEVLRRPGARR
jgi:hypothetical protein